MMELEESYRQHYPWMSDNQYNCFRLLGYLFGGFHHVFNVKKCGLGISIISADDLATFDFNRLTTLVFLAHDMCIRASVDRNSKGVKICLWQRERKGGYSKRHPTLGQALEIYRESYSDAWKGMVL